MIAACFNSVRNFLSGQSTSRGYALFPNPCRAVALPQTVRGNAEFLVAMLPYYQHIEMDVEKGFFCHGRGHAIRTWLFAACMSRICLSRGVNVDMCAVLSAAAGHDAGRQGWGEDIWERGSARITVQEEAQYAPTAHLAHRNSQFCVS